MLRFERLNQSGAILAWALLEEKKAHTLVAIKMKKIGDIMTSPKQCANAIRALAMDAVQQANSGHPGMPMGMADIAEVLWRHHLNHNPCNPHWLNRDRFVLSNGHGSMLLYALLHLTGYDLSLEDIKAFRQLHSKTAGHPEYAHTPGVETTTGPLGQGIANAVGMAIAEKHLAAKFNQPKFEMIDHHTYVFLGDGCLMEGVSHEACSLAGTLKLGKLIAFWDDNGISIDGEVQGWFTDDTPKRFESYGWHVISDVDGHDAKSVDAAIKMAQANVEQPTLICCLTTIGFGAPTVAGKSKSHGAPLGAEEIAGARKALGWEYDAFEIPGSIYAEWDAKEKGQKLEAAWQEKWSAYEQAHPELAAEFVRCFDGGLAENWTGKNDALLAEYQAKSEKVATRKASQMVLEHMLEWLPEMLGGSADLTGSNLTKVSASKMLTAEHPEGNYLYYGVREFGMMAVMNGLALYGALIPYGGTFLVFSDYARNAIRMAALMRKRAIYVLTHDSIGLGEDGPTHQPIEHVASLRLIPHCHVWRPADTVETAAAWRSAIEYDQGPTVLALSRQGLPVMPRTEEQLQVVHRGGYILEMAGEEPDIILAATGSEVELMALAARALREEGFVVQVSSLPCMEVFAQQPEAYQQAVLPRSLPILIAEAGVTDAWYKWIGVEGAVIGIDGFGLSAPADVCFKTLGLTVEVAIEKAKILINNRRK